MYINTDNQQMVEFLYVLMAQWYSMEHMYPNFFIHSPRSRHPGCCHDFAVVDPAVLNAKLQVTFAIFTVHYVSFE